MLTETDTWKEEVPEAEDADELNPAASTDRDPLELGLQTADGARCLLLCLCTCFTLQPASLSDTHAALLWQMRRSPCSAAPCWA